MGEMLEVCKPEELLGLLPQALAGQRSIAPLGDAKFKQALCLDEPADNVAVVVTTSGSTGTPKPVSLSAPALLAGAEMTRNRYGSFTWTCVLPTEYVAGLMVLVRGLLDRPITGGEGVIFASSHLSDLRLDKGANAISIVPTQLVKALDDASITRSLTRYDLVLVGGAPLNDETLERAQSAHIPVVQTYGMSETCGGVIYDGYPLPGVKVQIGDSGRISLSTPSAFSGYRGLPAETAKVLNGSTVITNDRGEIVDGKLQILGRLDDVVISGGVNVDLAAAQRVVDGIDPRAAIFAIPDSRWGTAIVLADPLSRSLDWWRLCLGKDFGVAALPKEVFAVDIPMTGSGKVDRQALRRIAESRD